MGELFKIGQHAFVGASKNVDSLMRSDPEFKDFVKSSLEKYIHNDWGDTCKEDAKITTRQSRAERTAYWQFINVQSRVMKTRQSG